MNKNRSKMETFKHINPYVLCFLSFHFSMSLGSSPVPDVLGKFHVKKEITLSGFSSGATFAQMLQFSYSSLFSGIAVFSHSYYRCGNATGNINHYDALCTKLFNYTDEQLYDPSKVHADIKEYTEKGYIENPTNLRNKRLYVYAGLRNALFSPRQTLSVVPVYQRYIGSLETIFTRVQDANLVLPTDNRFYGSKCEEDPENKYYFIGKCGFSGVTEAINFLLFDDHQHSSEAFGPHLLGQSNGQQKPKVSMFDQKEFTKNIINHSMDDTGYYYVPRRCKTGYNDDKCYLHFYFHGCLSGREFAKTDHVENTGLLELADRIGIIMIFPQALSSLPKTTNEIGCWDTFGLSGKLYATKLGAQIRAVKAMLDRILGINTASTSTKSPFPSGGWSRGSSVSGNGNKGLSSSILLLKYGIALHVLIFFVPSLRMNCLVVKT